MFDGVSATTPSVNECAVGREIEEEVAGGKPEATLPVERPAGEPADADGIAGQGVRLPQARGAARPRLSTRLHLVERGGG